MSAADALLEGIAGLAEAIQSDDYATADAEIEDLLGAAADVLLMQQPEAMRVAYPAIHKLYVTTGLRLDFAPEQTVLLGQLRTLVTLFAVAGHRLGKAEIDVLAGRHWVILHLLLAGERDSSDIAAAAKLALETVSRALSELRMAGFVTSARVWRQRVHQITPEGRERLERWQASSGGQPGS